ncbi:MAG: biotin/lipoyl-binding protein [Bacteroidales bacterium]|nr:biotin/lipoyl-binding protein [Bacteroidales bacterium]
MKKFQFTISGNKYDVELKRFEENIAEVEVNGTQYTVEVHREIKTSKTPKLVRSEVAPPTRSESKIKKSITVSTHAIIAPLPGTVLAIMVKEGDAVKKGTALLTYDAMKMENSIVAEKDGTVKSIRVIVGQNFLQGDTLVDITTS